MISNFNSNGVEKRRMIKDMEQSIQTKHNAAQSQEHIIAESSFPALTYDLEEYLNWIDSIPKEEVKEIQKNFLDQQLECYVKFSVGYINRNLDLKYNRSYDFSDNFVQYLTKKPKSFSIMLKKNWCEKMIESLRNLIDGLVSRKEELKLRFPVLKEYLEESYNESIRKVKKHFQYYKHFRASLEEDYEPPKNKYSDQDIQTASEIDLSHLFEKRRRSGKNWIVLCPYHNEKTPSMVLFDKKGFHCYGCGKHGSSVDLFMHINGCDFKTAVEQLLRLNY